jgi:GAF domain-containing protein
MEKKAKALLRDEPSLTEMVQQVGASSGDGETEELYRIGIALSSTRDVASLLEMILAKARDITGADAGSLYIVENSGSRNGLSGRSEKQLRFKLIQNDTRQFPFAEDAVPISEASLAGYAALHGEVVAVDDVHADLNHPYRFNSRYDEETGYRTQSLLTVPMKNPRGEVIGVMQLINCKRQSSSRLHTLEDVEREVRPFPPRAIRLAESLASQAAVAYENSQLYQSIETLLEGFVQASVTAIEQRDPTTSGHSTRVAILTVAFAEAVNRMQTGIYADVKFSPEQLKEIRYAALLHDFGKIAVREAVLVKEHKLYPAQLAILQQRFSCLHQKHGILGIRLRCAPRSDGSLSRQPGTVSEAGGLDRTAHRYECGYACCGRRYVLDGLPPFWQARRTRYFVVRTRNLRCHHESDLGGVRARPGWNVRHRGNYVVEPRPDPAS